MNKSAIFTIVKNEKFFIKLWYNYYSKYFDDCDIYILNHQSTDNSLNDLKCNIKLISNDTTFDHVWLLEQVKLFQNELLQKYDVVVFTEVDEFIVPTKCDLKEYLQNFNGDYVTCVGYLLCDGDVKYDESKLVLEQKHKFLEDSWSNKTLISKMPLNWIKGFHSTDMPNKFDNDLFLIHLHYFDYNIFMERAMQRMEFKHTFSSDGDGTQNKYQDIKSYENNFRDRQCKSGHLSLKIPIVF